MKNPAGNDDDLVGPHVIFSLSFKIRLSTRFESELLRNRFIK